jgi:hypothetical protein
VTVTLKAVGNISPGDTVMHQVTLTKKVTLTGKHEVSHFKVICHIGKVIGHIGGGHLSHK